MQLRNFLLLLLCLYSMYSGNSQSSEYLHYVDTKDWTSAEDFLNNKISLHSKSAKWDSIKYYNILLGELGEISGNLELEIKGKLDEVGIESFFSDKDGLIDKKRKVFSLIDTSILRYEFLSATYQGMANFYRGIGKLDSAIIAGTLSVKFGDKSGVPKEKSISRLVLANILSRSNLHGEAMKQLFDAEGISKGEYIGEILRIRISLEIGRLLNKIEDLDKALSYFTIALEIAKKNKYKTFENDAKLWVARVKLKQTKFDEAENTLKSCLKYYEEKKIVDRQLDVLQDLAKLYFLKKDFEAFVEIANKSISVNPRLSFSMKLNIGFAALARGDKTKALGIINDIYNTNGFDKRYSKSLKHFEYKYYQSQNQFKKALVRYQEYISLRDSINQSNQSLVTQRIESEFKRREQDSQIKNLSHLTQVQDKGLAIRNTALIMGSFMLLLLAGLLFGLYRLYQRNQKNQFQLKEQNVVITEALVQNKMLIKEIHHRVKNNLQVVSSLLSMQERKVTDVDTKDALKSSKTRVQSMSILHQNLYQGENLKEVEADTYIDQLVQNIKDTYSLDKDIKFEMDIDKVDLDVDPLIPLGLIVNELITNSLKYAFVDRDKLTVKDNGVGLDDKELPQKAGSLGTRLIKSFTRRLDGELSVDNKNGTKIAITFAKSSFDNNE